MSEEQLNAFLEKVKADTSLQEKLKSAGSNEAAIEIAKEALRLAAQKLPVKTKFIIANDYELV